MTITINDLITLALKDAGVLGESQTASTETIQDSLSTLNGMLALWNIQNLLSFSDTVSSLTVDGSNTYTLTNNSNNIDIYYFNSGDVINPYKLRNCTLSEFYNLTYQTGVPSYFNLERTSTGSTLRLNPNPSDGTLQVIDKSNVLSSNLTDTLPFPDSYILPIRYNLALLLCTGFNLAIPAGLTTLANTYLTTIKSTNSRIPTLKGYRNKGRYNIITDRYNNG